VTSRPDDIATRGERARHEAQLDDRPHADRHQEIEDAVDVEEREDVLVVLADQSAHFIVEQAVKAHVAKAQVAMSDG
jgi:hypothetical protein